LILKVVNFSLTASAKHSLYVPIKCTLNAVRVKGAIFVKYRNALKLNIVKLLSLLGYCREPKEDWTTVLVAISISWVIDVLVVGYFQTALAVVMFGAVFVMV